MDRAIPRQNPAVVLRSHFVLVRTLLAVAMVAVVALAGAVVILAASTSAVASRPNAAPLSQQQLNSPTGVGRYDGVGIRHGSGR